MCSFVADIAVPEHCGLILQFALHPAVADSSNGSTFQTPQPANSEPHNQLQVTQ